MQGVYALQKTVKQPFPPIVGPNSRTLILGTMASPKSRENGFYYGHPQNRFWPVLAAVFSREMQALSASAPTDGILQPQAAQQKSGGARPGAGLQDVGGLAAGATERVQPAAVFTGALKTQSEREALLLSNGLALWDVLAACDITGASDASIRNPVPNDIASLVKRYPIERVFTTGQTAARLYRRLVEPETGLPCTALPSPSPANCRVPFDALVEAYGALRATAHPTE